MSVNHLYASKDIALLVVGFPKYIADGIAKNVLEYNLYTDFTIPIQMGKLDVLNIYKKDDSTEIPSLGLSAREMKYLYLNDIYY
jgi:hypothetical protein